MRQEDKHQLGIQWRGGRRVWDKNRLPGPILDRKKKKKKKILW